MAANLVTSATARVVPQPGDLCRPRPADHRHGNQRPNLPMSAGCRCRRHVHADADEASVDGPLAQRFEDPKSHR